VRASTQSANQGANQGANQCAGLRRWIAAFLAGIAVTTAAWALDEVSLDVERVDGDGWSATGLAVSLAVPQQAARLHISKLRIFEQEWRDVRIDCPRVELAAARISCPRARIALIWPGLGAQSLAASIVYGRQDGALDLVVDGLRLGDGRASLQASLHSGRWTGRTRLERVPMDVLLKLAQSLHAPLPALSASGVVSMSLSADGAATAVQRASIDAQLTDVTANNESGSLASDKLALRLQAQVRRTAREMRFDIDVHSGQGQAYFQPIFLDLGAHALDLHASGSLKDGKIVDIERFAIDHAGVLRASGLAGVALDPQPALQSLQLELTSLQFPGAYESYLQPLLLDTNFKAMKTAGSLAGRVSIASGAPQSIDLNLSDVSLDDGSRHFALDKLRGQWHWRAAVAATGEREDEGEAVAESRLQWSSGSVFGLALGTSDLRFRTSGREFRLLEPARIALLDGAIDLESFRVRNAGMPKVAFMVDATIQPLSVRELCRAFGWPEFGGTIGGAISKLRMREGIVTLGTTLRAQVFDGEVTVRDLRLEDPFGQWPRMQSSIALDNLDLEPVSDAFSFGRITGRLSGAIDGLKLFNWTPVAFDARLYTPPGDRTKHRISQRAVRNIGSIGGGGAGVTAALSSGFLRFFEDFNYERLGLSCRLENEICVMDGVAPAPNGGYYLVKGQGLPRIDVIGGARRVDWPRLVRQLIAVTESGGPVVH
jgi:hypothetical protein